MKIFWPVLWAILVAVAIIWFVIKCDELAKTREASAVLHQMAEEQEARNAATLKHIAEERVRMKESEQAAMEKSKSSPHRQ